VQLKKLKQTDIDPCGYHLLVELLVVEETTKAGIILNVADVNLEQAAMPIGKVLKIGPCAFKNHDSGINSAEEWGFTIGDYIQFPSHTFLRVAGEKSNLVYILDYDVKAKVNINE